MIFLNVIDFYLCSLWLFWKHFKQKGSVICVYSCLTVSYYFQAYTSALEAVIIV